MDVAPPPGGYHKVAAWLVARVHVLAVRRTPELEAVTRAKYVLSCALYEAQRAPHNPDLVLDEAVAVHRVKEARSGRKLDLNQREGGPCAPTKAPASIAAS